MSSERDVMGGCVSPWRIGEFGIWIGGERREREEFFTRTTGTDTRYCSNHVLECRILESKITVERASGTGHFTLLEFRLL
jgi:hypothetical protein